MQISKGFLKDHVLEKLFTLFFIVVGKRQSEEEFIKVINDLFSRTERLAIAKRIAIIYLRLKGVDVNSISNTLKVTRSTIAKFSIVLEKSEGIVASLETTLRNEKIKLLLEEVFNTLYGPGTSGVDWTVARRRRSEIRRKKREGF